MPVWLVEAHIDLLVTETLFSFEGHRLFRNNVGKIFLEFNVVCLQCHSFQWPVSLDPYRVIHTVDSQIGWVLKFDISVDSALA